MADTLTRDHDGRLTLGGVGLGPLADRYGTPLYVMDVATLRNRLAAWRAAVGSEGLLFYAGKAFLCRAMAQMLANDGVGLDVVSGGELLTALAAGMPAGSIVFHGNMKSERELRLALAAGVGCIVADSEDELALVSRLAQEAGTAAQVWIRVTPGVDAHTHRYIVTGHSESKFGFALESGDAARAVDMALDLPGIRLTGYHCHIGSQILDLEPFQVAVDRLMAFAVETDRRTGFWPEVVDTGGGLGIADEGAAAPAPASLVDAVRTRIVAGTPEGRAVPRLAVEPGRSVAAEAGVTLYRVGVVKASSGHRVYVVVDGGMGDNIRPALYQARYHAEPVIHRTGAPAVVTLAGRYCESGDIVIEDERLPRVEPGDLVAVLNTGAYNYVMASQYNRVPTPAVVAVDGGTAHVWVERADWDQVGDFDRSYGAVGR